MLFTSQLHNLPPSPATAPIGTLCRSIGRRSAPPKRISRVAARIDFRAAVYGTISVGALLAAESANQETYLETVIAVLLTLLL